MVGASLGGMQALQFASLFPARAARLCAIAATGRSTPFTVGVRHMQRKAILWDPDYHNGDYADAAGGARAPARGLRAARALGTLFYRSREEFDARFAWAPAGDCSQSALDTFEVEAYLNYQGEKFVHKYDANAYLLLSKCMDLMSLGDGVDGRLSYAEGAARIAAQCLLIGVRQDALIPAAELRTLAEAINAGAAGRAGQAGSGAQAAAPLAEYAELDSPYGHDAFLKEDAWLGARVKAFLEHGLEAQLAAERGVNTGDNLP